MKRYQGCAENMTVEYRLYNQTYRNMMGLENRKGCLKYLQS